MHFQSMNQYKPNLLTPYVIFMSPELSKYIEENQPYEECPFKIALTLDHQSDKKQIVAEENEPPSANALSHKKYLKDDYQKNITINVVKCCIREMLSKNYEKLLRKRCQRKKISYEQLIKFIEPILKEVVISLGDLKKLLTSGDEEEIRLKSWYLRHKYMYYLLNEGKMNFKERYIEYKNKYILYLMEMIREESIKTKLEHQDNQPS